MNTEVLNRDQYLFVDRDVPYGRVLLHRAITSCRKKGSFTSLTVREREKE